MNTKKSKKKRKLQYMRMKKKKKIDKKGNTVDKNSGRRKIGRECSGAKQDRKRKKEKEKRKKKKERYQIFLHK